MRKTVIIAMALAAVLAVAGVAFATNTYTTTGSITPAKSGTKKAPKAVTTVFAFNVGTTDGNRPSVTTTYNIKFGGVKSFGKLFKNCSFAAVSALGPLPASDGVCHKALVGAGNVENSAGPTADPTPPSQSACHLDLRLYNLPGGYLAIRLDGGPSNPKPCVITVGTAIDAKFIASSTGDSLQFSVPAGLQHPIPGFDNAVLQTASTVKKLTVKRRVRINGRTVSQKVGFLSSVSCPRNKKRVIAVSYTAADGSKTASSATTPCTS